MPEIELDFEINNVVATVKLEISEKLDLVKIARKAPESEYNPEKFPGLILRLEKPKASFLIFTTGSMVITGLKKVVLVEKAVKNVFKMLKKFGLKLPEPTIKIENLVASGDLHTSIDLNKAVIFMESAMYEPEVFPGLIYHMKDPRAVFLIFSTGKIVCTGVKNEESVKEAILKLNQEIYELKLTFETPVEKEYEEIYFL
jgi:transcription initiation factor TFIID TATA-box-binding protein